MACAYELRTPRKSRISLKIEVLDFQRFQKFNIGIKQYPPFFQEVANIFPRYLIPIDKFHKVKRDTRFVRGYPQRWSTSTYTRSLNTPIFETATFVISPPAKANEIIGRGGGTFLEGDDYVYTRGGNPTQRALERNIGILEGAKDSIVYSSGMAAIVNMVLTFLQCGDHVICGNILFGDTHYLFETVCNRFGIKCTFIDTSNTDIIEREIRKETKIVFFESPNNPLLVVSDIRKISSITKKHGVLLAVDSTLGNPYNQNPIELGADIVIHSLTKYISGHSDAVGGAIIAKDELLCQLRRTLFISGSILDPFAAWNILKGIKTLPIRTEKQSKTALYIAKALEKNPKVKVVYYPGLKSHPTHHIAKKQMRRFGSVISFQLKDISIRKIDRLLKNLRLFSFAVSFGGTDSLIEYTGYMSHHKITSPTNSNLKLIRLSIGLEDEADLLHDLEQALG